MAKVKSCMSKITLITTEYPPYYGGVGVYYHNLIKNSVNKIEVIADIKNKLETQTDVNNVRYVNLFNQRGPLKWLKILKVIKQLSPDTIIWAGQLLPIGNACLLGKWLFKRNYFVSLHGLDWQTANKSFRKRLIARQILKQALFITVNSQATLKLLPAEFLNKTSVVYPATNISEVYCDDSIIAKYNLLNQKYFLTVGRLVDRKGQIQAVKSWLKISQEYKYVIVGNGPMQTEIQNLITESGLTERVILITKATNEQTASLYKHAYSFLFPVQPLASDPEGFGIVCLEAQYYNLPIITTNSGGIAEAVGDGAILMTKADEDEIIFNVNQLTSDKNLYDTLINKGQQNLKSFSWQNSAKIITNLINKYE